jgi:hypothetical protein
VTQHDASGIVAGCGRVSLHGGQSEVGIWVKLASALTVLLNGMAGALMGAARGIGSSRAQHRMHLVYVYLKMHPFNKYGVFTNVVASTAVDLYQTYRILLEVPSRSVVGTDNSSKGVTL